MGTDKAALVDRRRGSRTCVDATALTLEDAGARRVIVSGEHPWREAIADRARHLGPLGGIASVLASFRDGEIVLVTPVDMPLLTASDFTHLVEEIVRGAAAISYEGLPLPFALRCSPAALRLAEIRLAAGTAQSSVRGWLRDLEASALPLPIDTARFVSIDTPTAWERYEAGLPVPAASTRTSRADASNT